MRKFILFFFLAFIVQVSFAQNQTYFGDQLVRKGRFYAYWGWNRTAYTGSKMHFSGNDYDFTLDDVQASDNQTPFDLRLYFKPKHFKGQQSNFRFGYFLKEKWTVSIGLSHMKYIIPNNKRVRINGHIGMNYDPYGGDFENDSITIGDYMHYGYPSKLDYWNIEVRRFDQVLNLNKVRISLTEGVGIGGVKSAIDSDFLNFKHYSDYKWTGIGTNAIVGLRVSFFDKFFIQTEANGGFISQINPMVNRQGDHVKHHFFFAQANFLIGTSYLFERKNY